MAEHIAAVLLTEDGSWLLAEDGTRIVLEQSPVEVTPSGTEELRQFLKQFADSTTPWTYLDRYGVEHQVYLIRANEQTVKTSKITDEPVMTMTMIEAKSETHEAGATGSREQELFLLESADQVTPLEYVDRVGNKHRVYITTLEQKQRRFRLQGETQKLGIEMLYQVKMVDAWGGVFVQQAARLTITVTKTVTLAAHTTTKWGAFLWDLGQWE